MKTSNVQLLNSDEINDSDLLILHKSLYLKLITDKIPNLKNRNIAKRLYDHKINKDNIRQYYNHHILTFTTALFQNKLESITKYQ